ncbi:MAG: hypothetical protein ACOYON_00775 [Fimbriimonas sp.]
MLRIVGVQRENMPAREFLLLQNQGSMRVQLRGHLVMSDLAISCRDTGAAHAFGDEVTILPGMFVVLFSGCGEGRFVRGKDGALVYYAYMGSNRSVWEHELGPIHLMNTQHTFVERGPALFLH